MSKSILFHAVAAFMLLSITSAWAQDADPDFKSAQPPSQQTASIQDSSSETAKVPEARSERIHIDDGGTQIEEIRIRGETKSIEVKPQHAPSYEVVPESASQPPGRGDAAGQRRWRILSF